MSLCPVLLDVLSAGNVRDEPLDRLVRESRSVHEEETNRLFVKYLIVARHAGLYARPGTPGIRPSATTPDGA